MSDSAPARADPRHDCAPTGVEPGEARENDSRRGHSTAEHATRYIAAGLSLCAIPPGSKRPLLEDWPNNPRPAAHWAAAPADGMGAIMGLSGLVSLDLDALPESRALFDELGIDLDELIADAWIVRGNPARLRAEFRAPPSVDLSRRTLAWPKRPPAGKPVTVFELRAGQVQDVLPPTIHPDTHRPYEWVRGPDDGPLGDLPPALLELWQDWESWAPVLRGMCPWADAVEPPKPRQRTASDNPSVIGAFNQAHDVRALLEAHGYIPRGPKRWLAPSSESKLPGVVLLPSGRIFSHHGADPLATGHALDAFEVFNLLDHSGDTRAAVRAAADLLGMRQAPREPPTRGAPEDHYRPSEQGDPGPGPDDYIGADDPGPAEPAHRVRLLTPCELGALPAAQYRIKRVLPAVGVAAIFGPPKSGKSFLVMDMAGAIVEGRPWFGYRTRPCSVVYVGLEGEAGLAQRWQAYRLVHGDDRQSPLHFAVTPLSLLDNGDMGDLAAAILAAGGTDGIVIIDTLNAATPGADENSSQDMGRIIAGAKRLQREVGGLVLLIHHAGKTAGKGLRGHSSLEGALDAVIEVDRRDDTRTWCVTRSKDGPESDPTPFRLDVVELGTDGDGDAITSCVVEPLERVEGQRDTRPKKPTGANQQAALKALGPILRASSDYGKGTAPEFRPCVSWEAAMSAVAPAIPADKDRQRERANLALRGLIQGGHLGFHDGWVWLP